MPVLTAAQVAQLVKQAGFPESAHVTMVAIAKAESGFDTNAVNGDDPYGGSFGLFQINGAHKLDNRRLLSDAAYNTDAAKRIYDTNGLRPWGAYTSGAYERHLNEARQGVAQAAGVTGNPATPTGGDADQPSVTYGPNGPAFTTAGVGTPLAAAEEAGGPLRDLLVQGTQIQGNFAASVLGAPVFNAGLETVPNVVFTVVDPEGHLLRTTSNLWVRGTLVQYRDARFRVDQVVFEPGGHGSGQITITCVDEIVYALMNLRGSRTAQGISGTQWIAQELALAGIDPNVHYLGESVPTQSAIARDEADQEGASGGEEPSAWTTAVRLASELGKRIFVSGRRLVFGSSAFAMQWTASAPVRITRHAGDFLPGERWMDMPTARYASVGDRSDVLEVVGRVPTSRAKYFRPGVPVAVRATPAIAGGEDRLFLCSNITFDLGTDTSGADVTLLLPVDPPPRPPQQQTSRATNAAGTSNGESVSGGGTDGQISRFVALALQQAGKNYVWGANPGTGNADPGSFDCSSLVQWAAIRSGIPDPTRTTYTQIAKIRSAGRTIAVQDAINTKGALLFNAGPEHVAISLGNGKTIEAMNSQAGVRQGDAAGRFVTGGLLVGATGYQLVPKHGRGQQVV